MKLMSVLVVGFFLLSVSCQSRKLDSESKSDAETTVSPALTYVIDGQIDEKMCEFLNNKNDWYCGIGDPSLFTAKIISELKPHTSNCLVQVVDDEKKYRLLLNNAPVSEFYNMGVVGGYFQYQFMYSNGIPIFCHYLEAPKK